MERLKEKVTKRLAEIGETFSQDEDAIMEEMSDYVLSPYTGSNTEGQLVLTEKPPRPKPKIVTDDDIFDSIDSAYFISDDFNAIQYELMKNQEEMFLDDLERERIRLKGQLQIVSKRISQLILEKSPSYVGQLRDIDSLTDELTDVIQEVKIIRSALHLAHKRSSAALGVLANDRKKRTLGRLKKSLLAIKMLYESEFHLKDAIQEGQFPLAIRLCVEAKEAATMFQHFSCVSDLMTKLVTTTNTIEEELDKALAGISLCFDLDRYSYIFSAYCMLRQREAATVRLIAHFKTSLQQSVSGIVDNKTRGMDCPSASLLEKAKMIPIDLVPGTVRELLYVNTKILTGYHAIIRFHSENLNADTTQGFSIVDCLTTSTSEVFEAAAASIHSLITSFDLTHLKFDDLLLVVDSINRFSQLGVCHFNHMPLDLNNLLQEKTELYFDRYHLDRLEELRMFLENESFTACPVPNSFTIFDLQDFQFLKTHPNLDENDQKDCSTIILPTDFVNPFSAVEVQSRQLSAQTSVQPQDAADESADQTAANVCNTALNVLRFVGRYLRMTSLLPFLAGKSLISATQLFEFVMVSLNEMFTISFESRENLEFLEELKSEISSKYGVDPPQLSTVVLVNFPDRLYGCAERIVATESLEFVGRQYDLVRPVIEGMAHENEELTASLEKFYGIVIANVQRVRLNIIDVTASKALKTQHLVDSIAGTKWDLNELGSQHSAYIDFLLKDFEAFSLRLSAVDEVVPVSDSLRALLWDRTIFYAFKALVQGYCESGHCSTEGRALMQLDLQHLIMKLESLCGLKPIPHVSYVEAYIKAFYLPETGLEQWISQHSEYTAKQLLSLLGVANHVSKKARTRIINALND